MYEETKDVRLAQFEVTEINEIYEGNEVNEDSP